MPLIFLQSNIFNGIGAVSGPNSRADMEDSIMAVGIKLNTVYSVISRMVSPLHNLILEECVAVFQREMRQFQKIHSASLCSDAEQVT